MRSIVENEGLGSWSVFFTPLDTIEVLTVHSSTTAASRRTSLADTRQQTKYTISSTDSA